jgi:hypothetical protein
MNVKVQKRRRLMLEATSKNVIPAEAGIQKPLTILDSCRSLPCTGYGAGVTNG